MKRKQMKQQDDQCGKWKLREARMGVAYHALRIIVLFWPWHELLLKKLKYFL